MKTFKNVVEFMSDYRATKSGHFFDRSTLDFFASEIMPEIKKVGESWYFVTEEKACFDDNRRRRTIRQATFDGKWSIRSVEGFFSVMPSIANKEFKSLGVD